MPAYRAPLRDMRFLMNEVLGYPEHYRSLPNGGDATPDVIEAIFRECAKFAENVLSPLNLSGDEEGCHFEDGEVRTPKGFKQAYAAFVDAGWQGLSHPAEYGGQGLPYSLGLMKSEILGTANWSFGMYPGLSLGAMNTILQYASAELKRVYLPPMTSGKWTGTMCLTEPQCGTDLGQVRTRAEPLPDGSYAVTGTKIFVSAGEHDLAENIVHVMLARLPHAPPGTRGISLFVVPKYLPNSQGGIGARNAVICGSIEHKMGIKASSTAMLHFEGAIGHLIGAPNKGLEAMFTFMNTMRIGTAIQGVGHAELSFQGALAYAKERRSMRALSGPKSPELVADAIIHHADVRRMLLTQKAIAEGGRAMIYRAVQLADHMFNGLIDGDQKTFKHWDDKLGFLTPILKGFLAELGQEAANLGIQVFGGHGYIREQGMEQIVRDARIASLYEGTTGIQALDLLGRKVLLMTRGRAVREFSSEIARFVAKHMTNSRIRRYALKLARLAAQWNVLTLRIMLMARRDRDAVSAASYHYLMYSGYVTMAYFWALQASVASDKIAHRNGGEDIAFYRAKLQTARFYFDHLLPRAQAHATSMVKPSKSLTNMSIENFGLG